MQLFRRIITNFKQVAIQVLYIMEYNVIQLDYKINIILLILSELRNFCYIMVPTSQRDSSYSLYFVFISWIARPYIFLDGTNYYIVFALLITLIQQSVLSQVIYYSAKIDQIQEKQLMEQNNMKNIIVNSPFMLKCLNIITSLYAQLIDLYIINISIELSLNGYQHQSTTARIFIYYCLFQHVSFQLIKTIYHKAFTIEYHNLHQSRYPFLDPILNLLNLAQIFLYVFADAARIQIVISMLISLLKIINLIYFYPFTNLDYYYIILPIQAGTLLVGTLEFIRQFFLKQINVYDTEAAQFILMPIIIRCIIKIFELHQQAILFKPYEKSIFAQFSIVFSYFLSIQFNKSKPQLSFQTQIQRFHYCEDCKCDITTIFYDILDNLSIRLSQVSHNYYENQIIVVLTQNFIKNYLQSFMYSSQLLNSQFHSLNQIFAKKIHLLMSHNTAFSKQLSSQQIKQQQIQFTQICRLTLIKEQSQDMLFKKIQFTMNSNERVNFNLMTDIILTELRISKAKIQVHALIQEKTTTLQILNKGIRLGDKLYSQIIQSLEKIINIKDYLIDQFKKEQNHFIQNILCFIHAEILNDIVSAQRMFNTRIDDIRINLNTEESVFLITTLEEECKDMKIAQASENISQFFKVSQLTMLSQLLPNWLKDTHPMLVQNFLITGKSNRYRKVAPSIISIGNKLDMVEIYIDSKFTDQQLQFVTIIRPILEQTGYMILDQQFIIQGINEFLQSEINLEDNNLHLVIGQSIETIITDFNLYLSNQLSLQDRVECFFPAHVNDTNQRFYSIIAVETRFMDQTPMYYIVKFQYLARRQTYSQTADLSQQTKVHFDTVIPSQDESIEIEEPYQFEYVFNFDQNIPAFSPRVQVEDEEIHKYILQESKQIESNKQLDLYKLPTQLKYFIDDKREVINQINHQKSSQKSSYSKDHNRGSKENAKIDQELNESQFTGANALQQSKYWKKHELFNKLDEIKAEHKYSRLALSLLILCILLQISCAAIQFSTIHQNLDELSQDVSFLRFKFEILQPIINQNLLRFIILYYQQQKENVDESFYNINLQFSLKNFPNPFQSLYSNVIQVQSIKQLDYAFIEDLNITTYNYAGNLTQEIMNFRQIINMILNYQYELVNQYELIDSSTQDSLFEDKPEYYFVYLNFVQLFIFLDDHLDEVRTEGFQRQQFEINTQILIAISFALIQFTLLSAAMYNYCKFIQNKQLILNAFNSFSNDQYLDDLTHLNKLSKFQNMQFYQFNLNTKERQIDKLSIEDQVNKPIKHRVISASLNLLLVKIVVIYFLLLTSSLINTLTFQSFASESQGAILLYHNYSELTLQPSMIYNFREQSYQGLYGPSDQQFYDESILGIMGEIQYDSQQILRYDFQNSLFTQAFRDEFNFVQQGNLCTLGAHVTVTEFAFLCPIIFDGTMLLGFQSVISYIQRSILSEYSINKFRTRTSIMVPYDLEDMYIWSLFSDYLNLQMKDTMVSQIASRQQTYLVFIYLNQVIFIINLCILSLLLIMVVTIQSYVYEPQITIGLKFMYLIPSSVLFFDNTFERRLRGLILKNGKF